MSSSMMIIGLVAAATASNTLTLDEALETARAHQPALRGARAEVDAAEARVDSARAGLFPQVSASASYQRSTSNSSRGGGEVSSSFDSDNFFNFGVDLSQLIYDFGKTSKRRDAARATKNAVDAGARATELDVGFQVRSAFFSARAAKALVRVARETLDNQLRHLQRISAWGPASARPADRWVDWLGIGGWA